LLEQRLLPARDILTVVLDEADVLLSMGFTDAVYDIFQHLPSDVQVVVVSATMPPEAVAMTDKILRNPTRILLAPDELKLDGLHAYFVLCERRAYKYSVLCDIFEVLSVSQSIIFVNRKHTAVQLAEQLEQDDFTVALIHGELEQRDRELVLDAFRAGSTRVLVATDIVSRGLDVQQVSLVINYDMPSLDNYIHRVGRAGRFGRKGAAINLVDDVDLRQKEAVERHYALQMEEMPQDVTSVLK
jgi:superfamily II DNA/RNA helicase